MFLHSLREFNNAIEYLSVRDVLQLFIVCRKIADFRRVSETFWGKCLVLCDGIVLHYLSGLVFKSSTSQLSKFLDIIDPFQYL
jgi:hypothetical protein